MGYARFSTAFLVAAALGLSVQSAAAEELTVATFAPPPHRTNTVMFKWFGEELEERLGGPLTMKLFPTGQLGTGSEQQNKRAVDGVADIAFGVTALTRCHARELGDKNIQVNAIVRGLAESEGLAANAAFDMAGAYGGVAADQPRDAARRPAWHASFPCNARQRFHGRANAERRWRQGERLSGLEAGPKAECRTGSRFLRRKPDAGPFIRYP